MQKKHHVTWAMFCWTKDQKLLLQIDVSPHQREISDVFLSWIRYASLLTLRKKCPYSELFWSLFFGIQTKYREILRISPYSVWMSENMDQNNSKYGHFLRSVPNVVDDIKMDSRQTLMYSNMTLFSIIHCVKSVQMRSFWTLLQMVRFFPIFGLNMHLMWFSSLLNN